MTQQIDRRRQDEQLFADAVAIANVPTLLMVLVQLTGERRWIEPPYRPTRPRGVSDNDDGGPGGRWPSPPPRRICWSRC